MVDSPTIRSIAPMRSGRGDRDPDDLVCWLHAIHVCHVEANNAYDVDGYLFFFNWYCSLAE